MGLLRPTRDVLAEFDGLDARLCGLHLCVCLGQHRALPLAMVSLTTARKLFVVGSGTGVEVADNLPLPSVLLCVVELRGALFVGGDHGDASVDLAQHLGLGVGGDAVCELAEALMQPGPERQPIGDGCRDGDGAEAGDVLVLDLAGGAAGFGGRGWPRPWRG